MELAVARPPFVEFKRIPKTDVKRSEEAGYRVTKDVDMAYIMQPGSKDQVERIAADWLAMIKQKAMDGAPDAFPMEWVIGFHNKYKAWLEGLEPPVDGTSVREWPLLSPAQVENFISLHVLTIEDVAAMTEEAMQHYGMGARELREKAREWLKGKEISNSVQQENEELKKLVSDLSARLAALEEEKPKRGRKPAVQV